jgi:hypothetical protein
MPLFFQVQAKNSQRHGDEKGEHPAHDVGFDPGDL